MQAHRTCIRNSGLIALVALAIAVLGVPPSAYSSTDLATRSAPNTPYSAQAVVRLTRLANRFAAESGDTNPLSIGVVVTTHASALAAASTGEQISFGRAEPVYLIAMEGHFTAHWASPPHGGQVPTGHFLFLVIDRRTFRILDNGLIRRPVRLPPGNSCWTPLP